MNPSNFQDKHTKTFVFLDMNNKKIKTIPWQ